LGALMHVAQVGIRASGCDHDFHPSERRLIIHLRAKWRSAATGADFSARRCPADGRHLRCGHPS
jgi:hypothetical protein